MTVLVVTGEQMRSLMGLVEDSLERTPGRADATGVELSSEKLMNASVEISETTHASLGMDSRGLEYGMLTYKEDSE